MPIKKAALSGLKNRIITELTAILLYLPRFNTPRADRHFDRFSVDIGTNALEIRIEFAKGPIVRVRNVPPALRSLSTYIAYF